MRLDILARHAEARVPRYTSYPTAPHFSEAVTPAHYAEWLSLLGEERLSLYLHVPYCTTMCWYCGCNTRATQRPEPVERYFDILEREIDAVAARIGREPPVSHVHWGGGTPTIARAERLGAATALLKKRFAFEPDAEVAIEIDPRTITPADAEALAAAGFNRASLGVQSFDPDVQAAINRRQTEAQVKAATDALRAAGVAQVSFDLMYGLPRQTVENCVADTRAALALGPDRLSVFGYAHVPHMKTHQRLIDEAALPDALARIAQSEAIAEALEAEGYVAIGIDHYARPDDPMAQALAGGRLRRNFQGYTTDDAPTLIGFGASAIGRLPQGFVQNAPSTAKWARAITSGELATARGVALTPDDRLRAELIERLMCDLEVDLAAVAAAHGAPPPEADITVFELDGVACRVGSRITINPEYRALARNVAAAFDARLSAGAARHSRAV